MFVYVEDVLAVPRPRAYVFTFMREKPKEEVEADWAFLEEQGRKFRENNLVAEGETK